MRNNTRLSALFVALIAASCLSACNKGEDTSRVYMNVDHWLQMSNSGGATVHEECVNDLIPGKEPKVLCHRISKTAYEDMQFQHIKKAIEASESRTVKSRESISALEQLPDAGVSQ